MGNSPQQRTIGIHGPIIGIDDEWGNELCRKQQKDGYDDNDGMI